MSWKKNLVLFMPVLEILLTILLGSLIAHFSSILIWIILVSVIISLAFGIKELIANKKIENKEAVVISIILNILIIVVGIYQSLLYYFIL